MAKDRGSARGTIGGVARMMCVTVVGATAFLAGSAAAAAPSQQDTTWMIAAHQSNLAEIAAGQTAQQKATSQEVKDLGAMFVEHHTAMDAELTAAATELGVDLPDAPTADQQAQLAAVASQTGAQFDAAWIAQQIASHQATLQATQLEVSSGTNPTVVALAEKATSIVQQHLTALQELSSAAGAPTAIQTGSGGQAATSSSSSVVAILALVGVALVAGALLWSRRRRSLA